jgi:hypothetical protein
MKQRDLEGEAQNEAMRKVIEERVVAEYYTTGDHVFGDRPELASLTICVLVHVDGWAACGTSNPGSLDYFDAEIGRRVAREKAIGYVNQKTGATS